MIMPTMSSEAQPLLTLHPIADSAHRWAGVLLECDSDPGMATEYVSLCCGEYGLIAALGGLPCILPLDLLPDDGLAEVLPPTQTVLRLSAAFCMDPANAGALAGWRGRGYQLLAEGLPPTGASYPDAVTALAIDCAAGACEEPAPILRTLAGPHLALRVDDVAGFESCRGTGFRWIAGNYPLHPPKKSMGANPGRAVMLKLLSQVANDADSHDIEKTLKQDQQLSYQLLKMVNSVAYSLDKKIGSFNQAITLLGRRQLQRWLQLLLYARNASTDAANPLMPRAALRAGLMETLSALAGEGKNEQDQGFMVGMFSLLEPLFGQPVHEIIRPLNLPDAATRALLDRAGSHGARLAAIEATERGCGAEAREALAAAGVSTDAWARAQAPGCLWAIQISREA